MSETSSTETTPPAVSESSVSKPKRYPVVAIVGRPNVGKSSLLNALVKRRVAIVQDMPGVTRDRVSIPLRVDTKDGPRWTELVDTGGYGFEDEQGLTDHIKMQVEQAMSRADLVLFIVDATAGVMPGDETITELLRKLGRPVVLLANKADSEKLDPSLGDFARLGFGTPRPISAVTGRNTRVIQDVIAEKINLSDAPHTPPEPDLKIAIVGKRNAGKSTLVNAIAHAFDPQQGGETAPERVIVSEVAGTTRDSVDVVIEKDGRTMTVIDTAGVRKKRHMVTDDIEFYSYHRAQRSIRRADVVLLLIDATLKVAEPDKKLGQYIAEQDKPVIIVLNKWDLVKADLVEKNKKAANTASKEKPVRDEDLMEQYREYLDNELRGLTFAPVAVITAKDGSKVPALLDLCRHLHRLAGVRVGTGQLNSVLEEALQERTPGGVGGKRRPKVYYCTQIETHPPHLVLFVNDPKLFDESYRRFLLNRFRDSLPFEELPIKLTLRPRRQDKLPEGQKEQQGGGAKDKSARGGSGTSAAPRGNRSPKTGRSGSKTGFSKPNAKKSR